MNAKKLLSTLMSAAMAVTMLAGCFGGGGSNYSRQAADAANAAQSTVVFSTDSALANSLQDALADGLTQLDEIDDAMEADENLKPLLTSGWDLDIFAAQGEDAEAAAKTIAEQYIVSAVIGKKAEGKIAMVLHDGNGYYYVAVLTYGNGGSGSGGGTGGGSGSGDDHRPGGGDDDKPGPDDDENNPDNIYTLTDLTVTGPTDTEYWVDETFSTDGMTITAVYTNKKGDTKTESVDIRDVIIDDKGPYEDIDVGTKEISISYTEDGVTVSDTVSITVKAHELVSISVTNPDKTTYEVGETFEPAGMTVTGTYKNGDNSTIEKPIDLNKCSFTPKLFEDDVAGQEVTITVTYTENGITKYDTVTVNVKQRSHYITVTWEGDGKVYAPDGSLIEKSGTKILVEEGTPVTFKFNASDDYDINLKIDGGNLIENQSMYTFVNVIKDRTLHVIFEEKAHSVTIKIANECREQGIVMYRAEFAVFDDEYTIKDVMPDDSITFSVQAHEGYSVDKVVSDQRGELRSTSSGPTDPKYTLTDVTKNETVTVYFKEAK